MALMHSGPKPDSTDAGTVSVLPHRPHLPQWQSRTCGGGGMAKELTIDTLTTYGWIHHYALPDFPATDYDKVANGYFRAVEKGGGWNGLEQPASALQVPYHLNVSMGWDSSPRCPADADWTKKRGYPFGAVIVNNTPERFRGALLRAK